MTRFKKNTVAVMVFWGFVFLAFSIGTSPVTAMHHENGKMHKVESEFDFLVEMIPHHQEAVDSSREIKAITERSELQEFAEEVITLQKREIEELQKWIDLWYPDKSPDARYQPMMRDIEGLSVEEAEKAFLEDMVVHHEMAVMKSRQLLEKDLAEHSEVEDMARSIIEQQDQEIELMQKWLNEWF